MKNLKTFLCLVLLLVILQSPLTAKIDCRIEGIVVDQITGKPISGARLMIYDIIWFKVCVKYDLVFKAESDEDGYFKVDVPRAYSYTMACHKEGYISFKPDRWEFSNRIRRPEREHIIEVQEGEIKFLRIEMERSATVRGRFLKQEGGELLPLQASGWITLVGTEPYYLRSLGEVIADSEGYLEFSNLISGREYRVSLMLGNGYPLYRTGKIKVARNRITDISRTFNFSPPTGMKGIVSIGGEPPETCAMVLFPKFDNRGNDLDGNRYSMSRNSGEYLFRVNKPGKYIIKIDGYGPKGQIEEYEELVDIKEGEILKKDFHFKGEQ